MNLFVVAMAALWLVHSRQQVLGNAATGARNLALALDRSLGGTLARVDLGLRTVADEYERQVAGGRVDAHALDRLLALQRAHLTDIASLRIADAHGRVVFGEGIAAVGPVNIADRDYFLAARDDANTGLVVSKPLLARITGKWSLALARPLRAADGAFAGVVYANLTLDRLSLALAAIDVGPHGAIVVRDANLGLVVRRPLPAGGGTIGDRSVPAAYRALVEAGEDFGSFSGRSGIDGVERSYAFRRIAGLPLYVSVGLGVDDVLDEWRHDAWIIFGLVLMFLAGSLLAARLLDVAWRRQLAVAAAVEEQEVKFRTLADFAYDWEYWLDADQQRILYMTPSCERITGHAAEEFVADPGLLVRIIDAEDREAMATHLHDYAVGNQATIDFRIRRSDGSLRWIAHACQPIHAADGRFLGRRVSNRDITERKRAEAREARLHRGLRRLNEVAAVSGLPLAEHCQRALAVGAEYFGLEVGILSRVEGERYEIVAQVSPPGGPAAGQTFALGNGYCAMALASMRTVAIAEVGVSDYAGHPCYRDFNLESYIGAPVLVGGAAYGTVNFCSRQPLGHDFDDGDREYIALLARWFGAALERHQAQQHLAESEWRLRAIVENEPECVKVVAPDGTLRQMNRAGLDMIGADSADQVIGRPIDGIVVPEQREAFRALNERVCRGETGELEFEIVGLKGGRRWLETHAVPMRDGAGNITGLLGVTRDITERRLAEEALRKSEKRLRDAQRVAQIGNWELDLATQALSCSEETLHIVEIPAERFDGTFASFMAAVHPEDRGRIESALTVAARGRRPFSLVCRLLLDGDVVKHAEMHGEIADAEGRASHAVGTLQDVTLRVLNEQSLRESEERFRTIADYTYDWEYWQGPGGEILYISPSCTRVTGYGQADFISDPGLIYGLIHADDRHLMEAHLTDIHHEDEGTLDFRIVRRDGEIRWIAHGCRAVYAHDGRFLGRRASNRDITDRKAAEEQIQQLAYFDTLTGLPNRRMLIDRLAQALAQARRFSRSLAVMFLDLDNFKRINDTLGHDVGDELLKEVATRLTTCVRSGDTVARQGGDEFIIVLAEIAAPEDAALVAEKVLATLSAPVTLGDHALLATTSIGIAVYPVNGSDDIQELLKKADQAMYAAKAGGRNGYRFFAGQ